jgi:cysteine-rich repeat protein
MSTVTFLLGTKFEVGVENTMTVQARDSSGNNISTGGEEFYAKIMDQWTVGSNYLWVATLGRRIIVGTTIFEKMTDHGNGTYSYSFTINRPGNFTVAPMLYVQGRSYAEYFPNTACSGTHVYSNYPSYISYNWHGGHIYPGRSTYLCIRFHFALKAQETGRHNFGFEVDDGASLKIGDSWTSSASFIKDELYDCQIDYYQGPCWGSYLYFSWSYPGQGGTIVPSQSFFYPMYVTGNPIQAESIWGTGFYEAYSGGLYSCVTQCGDGIRAGVEICDDENTINDDGCSNTWGIEINWECDIQSEFTKDICTYCGDGIKWATEQCDDGNTIDGDGCSSTCRIEAEYEWWDGSVNTASFWTKWGDGKRHCSEECDDSNITNKDGWSSDCKIETIIWQCTGGSKTTADVCTYCGDGLVSGDEEWDDRNYKSGDGCSFADCKKELTHDFKYYRSPDDKKDIFTTAVTGFAMESKNAMMATMKKETDEMMSEKLRITGNVSMGA